MLKVGDIREWQESGGVIGVVASVDSNGYIIATDTGNEVPMSFSTPYKVVKLPQDLRNVLDDLSYRYKRVLKLNEQIIDCQKALEQEKGAIYYSRLHLNELSRKGGK